MTRTLIIDDEPLATEIIKEYLEDYPQFEIVGVCHNGFEGLKAVQELSPDLIFLDIQMPKINGLELLELLEKPPAVIFTTAFDEYAMKAFDAHAIDYLLKPFSKTRFQKSIEKFTQANSNVVQAMAFQEQIPDTTDRIVLKIKNEIKIIPVSEVIYLEANDDYVNIYTKEGKYLKNKTLTFYEKNLDSAQFVRVHRSYIVKIQEIHKIEPYEKDSYQLILRNTAKIPVSKTGLPKLKAALGI
ncbi:Phosphate regulon transcriptional regulatory protein PhoB (SphR) [Indibacter alkaliphilus LW1]|jgi:two-component system LytT family response regulator|uniref:Phosphate regulon transcriptional regulatory protein PhoB (SphR) n=1 Tax=Indibacter alkaliphilus (strain CCUG 57479 / KCTC 22604 / LW1) TaxID=1189612 RepID=S2E6I4_INDAL|nr:LytTR family transcriptional regulator DNA-binding domain-containing protein [Indibacter alkaliphilus]EPA00232.1 Phosphate regulon transcriptional regulatory protein PhoB (SphR) [Indibacter alkaliphilus LW1]